MFGNFGKLRRNMAARLAAEPPTFADGYDRCSLSGPKALDRKEMQVLLMNLRTAYGEAPARRASRHLLLVASVAATMLLSCGGRLSALADDQDSGPSGPDAEPTSNDSSASPPDDASRSWTDASPPRTTDAASGDGAAAGDGTTADSAVSDAGMSFPEAGSDGGIDVTTACLVSDNKFVVIGPTWDTGGHAIVIEGGQGWTATVYRVADDALPGYIRISFATTWDVEFSTKYVDNPFTPMGDSLMPGLYADAQRVISAMNAPGLDVSGNGVGCNSITGQFDIIAIDAIPADLEAGVAKPIVKSFTATFEHHCDGLPPADIGCVHFTL
jgi:hypothetical protein